MTTPLQVGVFGGTFDPIHVGHLIVAGDVAEALDLDRVLFVPAGSPPHKQGDAVTPAPLRVAMVEAAIGDDPRFELSTLEVSRAGPSYTVDTLRQLAEVYGQGSLSLLIGSDQFRAFARWKDPETVVDLAQLVVVSRAGETVEPTDLVPEHRFRRVEVTRIDISSTQIRRKIQTGRSVRHMVPDPVLALIESNNLYRS